MTRYVVKAEIVIWSWVVMETIDCSRVFCAKVGQVLIPQVRVASVLYQYPEFGNK